MPSFTYDPTIENLLTQLLDLYNQGLLLSSGEEDYAIADLFNQVESVLRSEEGEES